LSASGLVVDIGGFLLGALPGPVRAESAVRIGRVARAFLRQSSIIAIISAIGRVDLRNSTDDFVD
jgi:hypothetical protein